jgi:hypothetical protein
MEHPNDMHLRRQQVEDGADALAYAMQASAPERDRANDEAAFQRAVTTANALLHGRADGVKEVSLTMGAVTIYIRGPRDDTEIEMDLTRRLHNARGENLIEAAALLWATGCYLRDQERRVANAVADMTLKQSVGNVREAIGQASMSVTNRLENRRLGFPFR